MVLTTDSQGLITLVKSDTPACRWSFIKGCKGNKMKLNQEHETEVFLNDAGGVSIAQQDHVCPSCNDVVQSIVFFGDIGRIRAVADELIRLANAIEAEAVHA